MEQDENPIRREARNYVRLDSVPDLLALGRRMRRLAVLVRVVDDGKVDTAPRVHARDAARENATAGLELPLVHAVQVALELPVEHAAYVADLKAALIREARRVREEPDLLRRPAR